MPIYTTAEEFLVRYRDGQQRFSRTFERLDQAQVFARFLAHRQHWLAAALELGVGQRTPVVARFIVGPATANIEAVEQFLSACAQMGTSATTLRTMADLLRNALPAAPTVEAWTVNWARRATSPPGSTAPHRAVRRAIVGRFLGWLAHQPMEVQPSPPANEPGRLPLAQAEAVLRACPDLDTQRWVALSLFAGLRPHEVESLHWQDVLQAMVVHGPKSKEFRLAPVAANLLAWLKTPDQAHGPVVTEAARRKVKALLLKLKVPLHALRTTCVLCWLALHGAEQTALHAGISKVPSPDQHRCPLMMAQSEA
ncbi:MAG: Phage integrase family [Verrucomicrobiota bacterium]